MFLTNNLYAWADEFLNIQLLQLVVFNLIFEDNVYKLFHSICSVKLCFVFFLSLPCIGGTKKTKKHTNCACFLDKQLVLMSKGIFGKPHFYSQQFIDWSPRMMHTKCLSFNFVRSSSVQWTFFSPEETTVCPRTHCAWL